MRKFTNLFRQSLKTGLVLMLLLVGVLSVKADPEIILDSSERGVKNVKKSDILDKCATITWQKRQSSQTEWQICITPELLTDDYSFDENPYNFDITITNVTGNTAYTYTNLTPNTTYYVRLRSYNNGHVSDWSSAVSFTTLEPAFNCYDDSPGIYGYVYIHGDKYLAKYWPVSLDEHGNPSYDENSHNVALASLAVDDDNISEAGELTVPETFDYCGETYTVTWLAGFWCNNSLLNSSKITSINMSGHQYLQGLGTQTISMTNLVSVDFSNCPSLKYIFKEAFGYCEKMESANFRNCTSLLEIGYDGYWGSNDRYGYDAIFPSCFSNADSTYVDFSGCTALTYLGENILQSCNAKNYNFTGCTGLKTIADNFHIGSSDATGSFILNGCSGLETIGDNFLEESYLTSLDMNGCVSLWKIGDYFCYTSKLKAIDLPGGDCLEMGDWALAYCYDLEYINMEEGVETIGNWFGWGTTKLEKINFPSSLTELGKGFLHSSGIRSIVLPETLEKVGIDFLMECTHLQSIYLLSETPPAVENPDNDTDDSFYNIGIDEESYDPGTGHMSHCVFYVPTEDIYHEYLNNKNDNNQWSMWHWADWGVSGGTDNSLTQYNWPLPNSINLIAHKWSTICFPFNSDSYKNYLKSTLDPGSIIAEFSQADKIDGSDMYHLTFRKINIDDLNADQPYVILSPVDVTIDMIYGEDAATANWQANIETIQTVTNETQTKVRMRGNYLGDRYIRKDVFYLTNKIKDGKETMGFSKTSTWGGSKVPAYKCYFEINQNGTLVTGAKMGNINMEENVTGITEMNILDQQAPAKTGNGIFTLNGQRIDTNHVNNLPSGIYIIDGAKVIIK